MTSVRPAEFVVDTDDPFKYDRLARQGRVKALCRIIVELQSPAVLAVNGPFGSGKSVFLRLCSAHLRGQGLNVVEFNAWQQSHTEVPLVDLVAALTSGSNQPEEITDKLRQVAVKLAWRTASAVTHGIVDREASQGAEDLSMFGTWKDLEDRRAEFRKELANLANHAGKLVVLVDELDRCPPERALRLLDAVRHLFDISGVVVVLGINELELRHRVKKLYGDSCNAEVYLRRFIDLTIDLPGPGTSLIDFLNGAFTEVGLAKRLEAGPSRQFAGSMIELLARQSEMNARDILQMTYRIARILALIPAPESERGSHMEFLHATLCVWVLRHADLETYRQFASGAIDSYETVAALVKRLSLDEPLSKGDSFAGMIVAGLLALGRDEWEDVDLDQIETRLAATTIEEPMALEHILKTFNRLRFTCRRPQLKQIIDLIELAV